jgi:hypothetical protein
VNFVHAYTQVPGVRVRVLCACVRAWACVCVYEGKPQRVVLRTHTDASTASKG